MNEYIDKRLSSQDLEQELLSLIKKYNEITDRYLFVYAAALNKQIPAVSIGMDDFYIAADILPTDSKNKKLDVYIETPGGSGEAAEELVKMFRSRFDSVNFVISGEAKSAGTLMALSADEIIMTSTGSLGPVDAQVMIGRGQVSAYDYIAWVEQKQQEAQKTGILNPFDATMVAQISPGELNGVDNALQYAHDLVVGWLPKYKFKDWSITETTKKKVTEAAKQKRAKEIAQKLTNHSRWRSHGRSLKIEDLEDIGLKILRAEDNEEVCDVIKRIQVVLRLLFTVSNIYKVFAIDGAKIVASAAIGNQVIPNGGVPTSGQEPNSVQLDMQCPQCGRVHSLYAKLMDDPKIDDEMKEAGRTKLPNEPTFTCECGFEIDVAGARNQIETQVGRKLL